MRMGPRTVAVCVLVCLQAVAAAAQGKTMTLAEVLARAREQAPQIVSARLALEEARGRLAGASIRHQANPEVDAALGNRTGPGTRYTDFELGIGQKFEPSGRRSARRAGAFANIAEGSAQVDEVTRSVLRSAAVAYYRALHAKERIRLLTASYEVASAVYSAADRRYRAGDIAVLDVNLARTSLARVRAEREAAEASRVLALGELHQLLRLEADVGVDGTLSPATEPDLIALLASASFRPELRGLQAGIEEANARAAPG